MKKESLKRGNAILKEIANLEDHLEQLFPTSSNDNQRRYEHYGFEYSKLGGKEDLFPKFRVTTFFNNSSQELRNEFVPFPIDKFMKIYVANVREKIALLEKEFENLI